ncbi:hypothetical protein PHMEG_00012967 [Phytophthora megakarya]|uniref:Serine protease n=1 Tax=Phytophthora megakarya TaxID=4795 RepID=A0A225W7E7_9STRA|nr:hypothetical protein PHMEG_00012967 [Phytophthora megakarya]
MLLYRVVAAALTLTQVSSAAKTIWSPCNVMSTPTPGDREAAQCTVYKAPLCYPGVCETPDSVSSTVDVFVKRFPANNNRSETAPNVWLLQGGPGFDPAALDTPAMSLYLKLNANVNVYTMHHRGVGKSTNLYCESASGLLLVEAKHVPACAQELEQKFGDLAAFSTTSAAKDLASFISEYGNDLSTTVYGVGYGTMWVERLIHLDPPEVTGYVLDSVFTTSGAPLDKFMNVTSLDAAYSEIADDFMDLCSEDKECSSRFKKKGLKQALYHVLAKLDKNPTSTCAKLLTTMNLSPYDDPPSFIFRGLLLAQLQSMGQRTLIPPMVYRFLRCAKKDVDVLTFLTRKFKAIKMVVEKNTTSTDVSTTLLENLIEASERWESPTPSVSTLRARFKETGLGGWGSYLQVPMYCAMSKEKSPVCNKLKLGNYKTKGIIYERDEYWNKAAKIPKQASVLLMSSEVDPKAPPKYAEYLLEALDGDKKELITFKNTTEGNLIDTYTNGDLCGMTLLASFVQGSGDLDKLNRTCVEEAMTATPIWNVSAGYARNFFSTDDAYDGVYDESLTVGEWSELGNFMDDSSIDSPDKSLAGLTPLGNNQG